MKKSTSLFWWRFFDCAFTCRTICPRRECRGRNHPHPQLLPIRPKAWHNHPWGSHHPERQESFKLSQHHGSIFIFVVQFAQLNVVMVVTSVVWLLDGLLDKGYNLVKLAVFLLNIVGLSVFDSGLLGEVHAKGIEDVHEIVHVKFALAMPIVDIADPFNFSSIDRHVE